MTASPHGEPRHIDLRAALSGRRGLGVLWRALQRLWGRDVMLYVGGVSFFTLLAVFPGLALMIGGYSLLLSPAEATHEADALSSLMPAGAQQLFHNQLMRLAHAPGGAVSAQSAVALIIGCYAAHRAFKALLAGLSFIHEEEDQRGFLGFNLMALITLVCAFVMGAVFSIVFLGVRVIVSALGVHLLDGLHWIGSEWTLASVGLTISMALVYRYAMSREPVVWSASLIGGGAAAMLCLFASWASAVYVEQIAHLGATYGSVSAVIVFLIWLSWNVNAVFYGGALATEVELAILPPDKASA